MTNSMFPQTVRPSLLVISALSAFLCFIPSPAGAGCWDDCCNNWSEYQDACACSGGTPLPNPPRCEGVGDQNVAPPSVPNIFQLTVARWEAVRARLPAIGIKVDNRFSPQTLEELVTQVNELFVRTAFHLDSLVHNNDELVDWRAKNESRIRTNYALELELKARAAVLPIALQNAKELLPLALAKAKAQELTVVSVEELADRMHKRADRIATECVHWLTVASPQGTVLVSGETVTGRKTANRTPLSVYEEITPAKSQRLDHMPVVADRSVPSLRDVPLGTVEEKITAIERLIPRINSVASEYSEGKRHYAGEMTAGLEVNARVDALKASVSEQEKTLSEVERQNKTADSRAGVAFLNRYISGHNAVEAIAEAYILETFRDQVIIPEVIRFLRVNGIQKKLDGSLVAQLYMLQKSALAEVKVGHLRNVNSLIKVEKRALEVLDDFKTYALAAAEYSASPTDRRGEGLAEEIREGTQAAGEEIIKSASSNGTGPVYSIVREILSRPH